MTINKGRIIGSADAMPEIKGFSVARTIKAARGGITQLDFAKQLGVSQSNLSKYERGEVTPPRTIIEHCVNLLNRRQTAAAPDARDLAIRIKSEFSSADMADVRLAMALLLDAVSGRVLGCDASPFTARRRA